MAKVNYNGPYGVSYYKYDAFDDSIYNSQFVYVKYTIMDSINNKGYELPFSKNVLVHSITIYNHLDVPLFTNGRDDIVASKYTDRSGNIHTGFRDWGTTSDYIGSVLSKLTLFGGFFLSLIAVIPMFMRFTSLNLAFGGTAILIVVGVALETIQQLESQLLVRHYKGFLQ